MRRFAHVQRYYPMKGGSYQGVREPSASRQADGFKPTFISPANVVSLGDKVETSEINFLIGRLYEMADAADEKLTQIEG